MGETQSIDGGGAWGTYVGRLEKAERERDRYRAALEEIAEGTWNHARIPPLLTAREFALSTLDSTQAPQEEER